jgi:AhpD family alkylhydroperoxidase
MIQRDTRSRLMNDISMPRATRAHAEKRHSLAPAANDAFRRFSEAVFADGALDRTTKELIAVAVAHVTQCPWCIEGHVKAAKRAGATGEQIMEAIWVAAEMRAGAAFAHSVKALELIEPTAPGEAST